MQSTSQKIGEQTNQQPLKMKLLTHNLLRSNVKGVKKGYPLKIEPIKVEEKETEFNELFVRGMIDRLDWVALRSAAFQINGTQLPESVPTDLNEDFLKLLHHVLLEIILVEGVLVCPESGRKFKVENAIPNMLLNEDEI